MSWTSETILHDDFCPWYEDRCTCGKEADLLAEVLATTPTNDDPGPATTQSDWYMYVKALVNEVERLRASERDAYSRGWAAAYDLFCDYFNGIAATPAIHEAAAGFRGEVVGRIKALRSKGR